MTQPPSFEPQHSYSRPCAHGAKPIGRGHVARRHASTSAENEVTPSAPHSQAIPTSEEHSYPPRSIKRVSAFDKADSSPVHRQSIMQQETPVAREHQLPPSYQPRQGASPLTQPPTRLTSQPQSIPPASRPNPDPNYSSNTGSPTLAHRQALTTPSRKKITKRQAISAIVITLLLAIAIPLAWASHLIHLGNSQLTHVDALSGARNTPGTTYLIVGSDARGGTINDATEGQRADTIMLLQKPRKGATSLISLPRDSWVEIPGNGTAKLNASFSWGGPQLLVQTVEQLTGLTVDHYVQIGMDGVKDLTNAVGGVELCMNSDDPTLLFDSDGVLRDPEAALEWSSGCHLANGDEALAFSRMRKHDLTGDLGRGKRQREVVSAIMHKALTKETLASPSRQKQLVEGASSVLATDSSDSIISVGFAGLALRDAIGSDGFTGTPPIANVDYHTDDGQSAVLLDTEKLPDFWARMRDGELTAADFEAAQ